MPTPLPITTGKWITENIGRRIAPRTRSTALSGPSDRSWGLQPLILAHTSKRRASMPISTCYKRLARAAMILNAPRQDSCWKPITLITSPEGAFMCLRGTRHNWPPTAYMDPECSTQIHDQHDTCCIEAPNRYLNKSRQ